MKRATILAAVLLSGALFAQVRGVPASVTSYAPGRGQAPGVPASVTSLGPNGYTSGCNQPGCGAGFYPFYPIGATPGTLAKPGHNGHHTGNHHGTPYRGGGYAYIPYAVPVPVETDQPLVAEDPDPPAATVFEHRPVVQLAPSTADRYGDHYLDSREQPVDQQASAPRHLNLSPVSEEKIPVVIVFKDGHQQEIGNGNYAIVGDQLYDLSGTLAKKYKLADLDLQQTVQLNEQRGVEFSLPAAYKPQA